MNKVALVFISIVMLLTACQTANSHAITLEELLSSFKEQQLTLEEINSSNNIFEMKLNGVRPSSYELDGKMVFVFIYNSTKEREKGLEDFDDKTATVNLVSYNFYEVKNALIFYVYEDELNIEVDNKIQNAIRKLNEA